MKYYESTQALLFYLCGGLLINLYSEGLSAIKVKQIAWSS